VERSRLAAEEALREIVRVPKIEVADLGAFDTDTGRIGRVTREMLGRCVAAPRLREF
jgi:hypothetical protein